jgi:N-acetylglucosaminyldiphosphoundecaprenol N-acetyl-beta-D-mannosaminyltransferase
VDDVIDLGKKNVLGVMIDAVDYEAAVSRIIEAAEARRPYAVSALAVHGVMTGVDDDEHRYRLNHLDLVTPDGQPVRWAMNWLHKTKLKDRVYGPTLTLKVCEAAAERGLPIYLYGSTSEVISLLRQNLVRRYPNLIVAGCEPSKFRTTTPEEKCQIAHRIRNSGAQVVFVGLGCPRQEIFAYEYRELVGMPLLAVGAAFDYHSDQLKEPPRWIQRIGLQWAYRLAQDPGRLWRRYLVLNPRFAVATILRREKPVEPLPAPPLEDLHYG